MSLKEERNIGNPMWRKKVHREKTALWQLGQRFEWCVYKPKNAKDCKQIPESRRSKKRFAPKSFKGSMALPTPEFWTSSLQNFDRTNCSCLTTQCVVLCYDNYRKLIQLHHKSQRCILLNSHLYLSQPKKFQILSILFWQ